MTQPFLQLIPDSDDAVFLEDNVIAFDEGRTLPNLLGCLLSRRFPVHASES